ncbi:hypothetical protein GCM10029963_62510 [Micromonospora andamanensis]
MQLAAARGLIAASTDAELLTGWLAGRAVPSGLAVDTELRWALLGRLVVIGAAGAAEIAAEVAADPSATGAERAARCRAALPEPAAKQAAWEIIVSNTELSNRLVEATAEGFWQPEQAELTSAYVARYFADMPAAARLRTPWVADEVAKLAFPATRCPSRPGRRLRRCWPATTSRRGCVGWSPMPTTTCAGLWWRARRWRPPARDGGGRAGPEGDGPAHLRSCTP